MRGSILILGVCLVLAACSDPEGPEPLAPVKNTFEWQLDTIRFPGAWQFFLHDVFGTADGTVYATALANVGSRGMFWKYSENAWTAIELNKKYGGHLEGQVAFLGQLDGANGATVWMAGTRYRDSLYLPVKLAYGFLASYDGKDFKEVDLYYEPEITCLDVVADNDIWFGCRGPWIYHYDGMHIQKFQLPLHEILALSEHEISYINVNEIAAINNEIIIAVYLSYDEYGGAMLQLTLKSRSDWEIINFSTGALMSWGGGMIGFWTSKDNNLYSGGDHVYRYGDGSWNKLYWTGHLTHRIFGSSDRDVWAVGALNNVVRLREGQWIANEFFRIPEAHKSTTWIGGWTDGNEVFIVGNPDDATDFGVVAHGK